MSWPTGRAVSPLDSTRVTSHFHVARTDAAHPWRTSTTGVHEGTDFRALTGTPVRAPRDGIVMLSAGPLESTPGHNYGYGGVVGIVHPQDMSLVDPTVPVSSFFAHLSRVLVPRGTIVRAGDVIAESGAESGNPPKFVPPLYRLMGPHLHMEVRRSHADGRLPFEHHRYGELTESPEEWLASFGILYQTPPGVRPSHIGVLNVRGSTADPATWHGPVVAPSPLLASASSPQVSPPVVVVPPQPSRSESGDGRGGSAGLGALIVVAVAGALIAMLAK